MVEGGALRSVFSAGVLDGFLKLDFYILSTFTSGVSAGIRNA